MKEVHWTPRLGVAKQGVRRCMVWGDQSLEARRRPVG